MTKSNEVFGTFKKEMDKVLDGLLTTPLNYDSLLDV